MLERLKECGDACNLGALIGWLLGLIPALPTIALLLSIAYSLLRIYETWLSIKEKKDK